MTPFHRINVFIYTVILALCASFSYSSAHSLGQSYVFLQIYDHKIGGRFEITIADANRVLGLEDTPTAMTIENYATSVELLEQYYLQQVSFAAAGTALPIRFTGHDLLQVKKLADYITLDFVIVEDVPEIPMVLDIDYRVMFDQDSDHTAFLVIEHYWKASLFQNEARYSLIFEAGDSRQTLDLRDYSMWKGFLGVVKQGIKHILIGIDHILFIMALILPSVMIRRRNEWEPVDAFRPALIYVVKIITLFTIAHSVTLSLAALGIFELPSQFVESVIALSIAIAALDIIFPIFKRNIWIIVFGFGLFHGFGFASVLTHLGVLGEHMALSLFGFNLGVEIGQIGVIALTFPILFLLRKFAFYRPVFLKAGAAALIVIAMIWFLERAFDTELLAAF